MAQISYTIQGSYEQMRSADVTTDDTVLDGSTAGYTYDWHDKPSAAKELGPEYNACEIIFPCGQDFLDDTNAMIATDGNNFAFSLWGYAERGPAEFLCEVSGTVGTARIEDSTSVLYTDTLTIDSQGHLKTISVADAGGNNRVAKLAFDTCGLKYLYVCFSDTSAAINPYIKPI